MVADASGPYNGLAFPATAKVAGVSGTASSSLESVSPTLTYYAGSTASGTPLAGAPSSSGTYTAVAGFPGSADYLAAQSSPVTFTIGKGSPTVGLSSSGGSAVYGQTVSFVATVTAAGGTPTGTVTFSAGGTVLGTATLDSSGTATLTTTSLALGSSSVTAAYSGSTNLGTATSGSESESVGKASSQIVLVPQPVRKGKKVVSVGLEAVVTPVAPAKGTLTGTVTFETMKKKKVKVLGTETLSGGKATLTLKANAVLKKVITIVYSGDADALTSTVTHPALTQKSLKSLARPMIAFLHGKGHHLHSRA